MIKNPGRRTFLKKSLILVPGLSLFGCGGGGGSGSSTSTTTTTNPPVLPSLIVQPADQTIAPGETATFQALANGTEPLSYQWQRNGSNIAGATSVMYNTPVALLGDDAEFSVVVTNDAGTVSSRRAELTVLTPSILPSITIQPSDQSVVEGGQATFLVLAEGSPPLSYQWLRNGQPVVGATSSSYTTPPLALGDNATFSVTVANNSGSTTSLAALLTVVADRITADSVTTSIDSTILTIDST